MSDSEHRPSGCYPQEEAVCINCGLNGHGCVLEVGKHAIPVQGRDRYIRTEGAQMCMCGKKAIDYNTDISNISHLPRVSGMCCQFLNMGPQQQVIICL
jgi:hypothetical protein